MCKAALPPTRDDVNEKEDTLIESNTVCFVTSVLSTKVEIGPTIKGMQVNIIVFEDHFTQ